MYKLDESQSMLLDLVKCLSCLDVYDDEQSTPANSRVCTESTRVALDSSSKIENDDQKTDLQLLKHVVTTAHRQIQDEVNQVTRMITTLEKYRTKNTVTHSIKVTNTQGMYMKKQSKIPWTQEEHQKFLDGVEQFGRKKHTLIAKYIGTKETTQVISHSQKYFIKLDTVFNQILSQNEVPHYNKDLILACNPQFKEISEIKVVEHLVNTKQLYSIDGSIASINQVFYQMVGYTPVQIKQLYCGIFRELNRVKASIEYIAEKFVKDKVLVLLTLLT